MIKVNKYNFGDYFQKLIVNNKKIIDAECTCKWGQVHRKAWKNGEKICKHIENAIVHENLKRKGGKNEKR